MKSRTYGRLVKLECYAYGRWLRGFAAFWHGLAAACNAAVKRHPDYRGAA